MPSHSNHLAFVRELRKPNTGLGLTLTWHVIAGNNNVGSIISI
jgi:hypothetical protein